MWKFGLATIAGAAAALAVSSASLPASAEGKQDFKKADIIECATKNVNICGAKPQCTPLPGGPVFVFDMEEEIVCARSKPGGKCKKPQKFAAYEGGMLPGILFVVKENRSMFHLQPNGTLAGSQILAGVVATIVGSCKAKAAG